MVGPANSLEETGNLQRLANSPKEAAGACLQAPTRRQASLRFGCILGRERTSCVRTGLVRMAC